MKIVTFGELLLRLAPIGYKKLFQNECIEATFCGSEANVAVSLANFGMQSVFVTMLPDNEIGHASSDSLRYFGVDTHHIKYRNGRMGLFYLEKGASQRPSKVIYDRTDSAFAKSIRDDFDWSKIFDECNWFHWSGITPALSDELIDVLLEACTVAKKRGIKISCDLNYRAKLWNEEKAEHVMSKLMPFVDVCIGNEEDAEKVLGIPGCLDGISANNTYTLELDNRIRIAKEIYSEFGCEYIAFSLRNSYSASLNGWSGFLYDSCAAEAFLSKEYEIQIVDRVGGGDSFAAGIIYSLLKNLDNQESIDFAVAASCLKQTIEGDFNRVSVVEINNLINCGGSGRIQR